MDRTREERLTMNEAFFRGLNEDIRGAIDRYGSDGHVYSFVCECSNPACMERVPLSTREYESIREEGKRFVLAPGHDIARIEEIVGTDSDFIVVEKIGRAGEIADALDPRS